MLVNTTFHIQQRWHSLTERTQNEIFMIKRNFSSILVIIAMILNILNFGYLNFNIYSFSFWLFIGSTLVLIVAFIKIFVTENKEKKKSISD